MNGDQTSHCAQDMSMRPMNDIGTVVFLSNYLKKEKESGLADRRRHEAAKEDVQELNKAWRGT